MKEIYTQQEVDVLSAAIAPRTGWDFSQMNVIRQTVPWEYESVVRNYIKKTDSVLDVGAGGGERMIRFADAYSRGVGVDIDPEMVAVANDHNKTPHLVFLQDDDKLTTLTGTFDVILNRHAPYDMAATASHLREGGYFITQQVGERNMAVVRAALRQSVTEPVRKEDFSELPFKLLAFMEYDVEYIVKDIESLLFWLKALDMLHADLAGAEAVNDADVLNRILRGNVDEWGFRTNEHRYLAIAQLEKYS